MDEGSPTCFSCGEGRLSITSTVIDIPHFGEVDLIAISCPKCGYRSTDVIPAKAGPPACHKVVIDRPEALWARVVRSSSSTVTIPELGVRIDPGIASEGYITNAEGILERVKGILKIMIKDFYNSTLEDDGDRISRALELLDKIEACKAGRTSLTLTISDPEGNSAIIGDGLDIEAIPL
ncbi:MAG: ZPR1 zinc finger domain-containing protein [Candidatus Thermoplasmatota archaeon]|nr:ZPR1 zinc finger domain-containing protein [Candidatus Thermoplasmatota archaeon]